MRIDSVCGIGNEVQRLKKEMNNLHSSVIIAATIAAAIGVIGAVSITIYQKFIEQRNPMSNSNLDALNLKVSELQAELEALRAQQKKKKKNRKHVSSDSTYTVMDNDTDGDAFSTAGTDADIGDDEFFDCSDSEPDNDIRTAERVSQLDLALAAIDERVEKKDGSEKELYQKLQELRDLHPDNINVMWRYARACYNYCTIQETDAAKKTTLLEGIRVCERILEKSPRQNADFHLWYGILVGTLSECSPVSDKIKLGFRYRDQIVIALEMRPEDPLLYHLIGRFQYEVSSLSWIERKVAATLFSEPPQATFDEALENFEKAENLYSVPELRNRLYMAKAHIGLHNYQKAAYWLSKTCEISTTSKEEQEMMVEAKRLLGKYSSYI